MLDKKFFIFGILLGLGIFTVSWHLRNSLFLVLGGIIGIISLYMYNKRFFISGVYSGIAILLPNPNAPPALTLVLESSRI